MFFILAACLICWSKSSPVKWGLAVLRDEYDHVQGSKLKKSSGRLLATNWRNIVARCKFLVASLYGVNDTAHSQGFWYFVLLQSRKFTKTRKIPQNLVEIVSTTCLYNIFLSYWGYLVAINLCIYLETLSLKCANNVSKLPGIDYVAKNWVLAMMLKALPLVFSSGAYCCYRYVRKTLKTLVWSALNRLASKK